MKTTVIPSDWIDREDARLDVGPFVSGAAETKLLLQNLSVDKQPLSKVTVDIVNPGRFSRIWVKDSESGVPF